MRIVVDEMPETIDECPYFQDFDDGCYGCSYKKSRGGISTPCGKKVENCPYFVGMDEMFREKFRDEISKYDVKELPPWLQ